MDIDARSQILFGRYEAARILAAIARLSKPEFSTGQISVLSGSTSAQCSKEMGKLKQVGLIRSLSRRGEYERAESALWALVDQIAIEWGHPEAG